MDKKIILDSLESLLLANDISHNHKEALELIKREILKDSKKLSAEKKADYILRLTQIAATVWKLLD